MDLNELIRSSEENLIPAFVMVGDFIPVAGNGRKGASFFYDQDIQNFLIKSASEASRLGLNKKFVELEKQLNKSYVELFEIEDDLLKTSVKTPQNEIAKKQKNFYEKMQNIPIAKMYQDVGLKMGVKTFLFPYLTQYHPIKKGLELVPRFYILDREPDVNEMIESNIKTSVTPEKDFIYLDGRLHDYAYCCVKNFAELLEIQKVDPKKLLSANFLGVLQKFTKKAKLVDGRLVMDMDIDEPEETMYQFYSEEFFPHSIFLHGHCKESIEKGKAVYKSMISVLPKKMVNDYFYLNLSMYPALIYGDSGYSKVEHVKKFREPFSSFVKFYGINV